LQFATGDNMANKCNLRIGCAAGFSGDRTDAAAPVVQALVDSGQPAVLIFETLAERTLALAQLARRSDPDGGYEPLLVEVLGPALAHFDWALDDWDRLARATMAGHLLECGAQVTGGYFADPGYKDVPGLAHLGYPLAEIDADGHCTITKPAGTGGRIDERTMKEQLLYELHDPAAYLTPDVVADITQARVLRVGDATVRLEGVRGHARPATLKVNVCSETGWFAEGEISYAGARAEARAR